MARKFITLLLAVLTLTCTPSAISKTNARGLFDRAENAAGPATYSLPLYGPIDSSAIDTLEDQITAELDKGRSNVFIKINSPGGSVAAGFRFIQDMEELKARRGLNLTCAVDGMAASMAAVILEGACDVRLMTKRSLILFHGARLNGNGGTKEELEQDMEMTRVINEMMAAIVAPRLGMTEADYSERIHGRDWVLSWQDAAARNAVDGFVSPTSIPLVLLPTE